MKLQMFTVHDTKAAAFLRPFAAETPGLAVRALEDGMRSDPNHPFLRHAEDFTLYHIGEFSQETGELTPILGAVVTKVITLKEKM